MIKLNTVLSIAVFLAAGATSSAMAIESQQTMCKFGEKTRIIEVVYLGEGNLPCEVNYTKSGQETKTLWHAANKAGYCEKKADDFVEKQISWGWACDLVAADNGESTAM